MLDNIVYQKGQIIITPEIFKTARRTYKIAHIERIHIKRPWFIFSLPLSLFCFLSLIHYGDYLYWYEMIFCLVIMLVLPSTLFKVGTLTISSKALSHDHAITGNMTTLKDIRNALEQVIYGGKVD